MLSLQAVRLECFLATCNPTESTVELVEVIRSNRLLRYNTGQISEVFTKDGRWVKLDHAARKVTTVDNPPPWLSIDSNTLLQGLTSTMQWFQSLLGSRESITRRVKRTSYLDLPCRLVTATTPKGYPRFEVWLCEINRIHVPLKVISRVTREDLIVWDTLSLRQEHVPESMFAVPSDYSAG